LGRYSSSDDVVFGTAVSGRPPSLSGVESIVGVFINMLPLRVVLGSDAPLTDWLRQIQQRQIDMQQYEFTPLVHIQNWSDVPRGATLFESILVFENYPMDDVMGSREGGALAISNLRSFVDVGEFRSHARRILDARQRHFQATRSHTRTNDRRRRYREAQKHHATHRCRSTRQLIQRRN
jgi:non-ribosomal peptide synthetase component F